MGEDGGGGWGAVGRGGGRSGGSFEGGSDDWEVAGRREEWFGVDERADKSFKFHY